LSSARAVSIQRLDDVVNSPTGRFANLFRGVFYAGSDDRFDYFVIPLGNKHLVTFQAFKASRGAISVPYRTKLSSDEAKWLDVTQKFSERR
jgi:hypothetical protein